MTRSSARFLHRLVGPLDANRTLLSVLGGLALGILVGALAPVGLWTSGGIHSLGDSVTLLAIGLFGWWLLTRAIGLRQVFLGAGLVMVVLVLREIVWRWEPRLLAYLYGVLWATPLTFLLLSSLSTFGSGGPGEALSVDLVIRGFLHLAAALTLILVLVLAWGAS